MSAHQQQKASRVDAVSSELIDAIRRRDDAGALELLTASRAAVQGSLPGHAERVVEGLHLLGIKDASVQSGAVFAPKELSKFNTDAWIQAANALHAALDACEERGGDHPFIRQVRFDLRALEAIWLDLLQRGPDGKPRLQGVSAAAQVSAAAYGLKELGVTEAPDRTGKVCTLQDLREGASTELADIAWSFCERVWERIRAVAAQPSSGAEPGEALRRTMGLAHTLRLIAENVDWGSKGVEALSPMLVLLRQRLRALEVCEVTGSDGCVYDLHALLGRSGKQEQAVMAFEGVLLEEKDRPFPVVQGLDALDAVTDRRKLVSKAHFIARQVRIALERRWVENGLPASLDLTIPPKPFTDKGLELDGRARPIPKAAPERKPSTVHVFTGASLGDLKAALVPIVATDDQIADLAALIVEAQGSLPSDREAFVRDVNDILDAQNLRFSVNGGIARLAIKNGSVQFSGSGFGTCGFRKHPAKVIRVGEDFAVLGKRPRQVGAAPTQEP